MFPFAKGARQSFIIFFLAFLILTATGFRSSEVEMGQPPEPEKFALLVGINDYVKQGIGGITDLKGPENDVAMMKSLLVKKFGFKNDSTHIKSLLSRQATREAIIKSFEDILIKGAESKPGAVVVFYFSGHGSQTDDKNEDEGDGYDETIVPCDSRIGKVYDIIDDEIDELFERLRQHKPSNITFMLDSCNSGTGTRLLDDDLVAKEIAPDPRPQPDQKPVSQANKGSKDRSKDIGNGVLSRNDSYVTISGCLPDEKSYEKVFETFDGTKTKKHHGALTYFLVRTLETVPFTSQPSYREVMDIVSNAVTGQHPQIEGAIGWPMFGGASDTEDPFIRITGVEAGKNVSGRTFTIGAGAVHGLEPGGVLAIYKPGAKKLIGQIDWLNNAIVKEVGDFTAVAELPASPTVPIPGNAKVTIITPNFGKPLNVAIALDLSSNTVSPAPDNSLLIAVVDKLKDNGLIQVVRISSSAMAKSDKSWSVALVKDRFQNIKEYAEPRAANTSSPADNTIIYYLARRGDTRPMFGAWFDPNDPQSPQRVADALNKAAQQDRLRALVNPVSPLNGKLVVNFIRVTVKLDPDKSDCSPINGPNGKAVIIKEEAIQAGQEGTQVFNLSRCERLRFKFENQSDKDLYVTLISLESGGGIRILSPGDRNDFIPKNRSLQTEYFKVGRPLGSETYKVIAATADLDFRFLKQPGIKARATYSPLDLLFDRAMSGNARDTQEEAQLKLDSWTVTHFEINLRP